MFVNFMNTYVGRIHRDTRMSPFVMCLVFCTLNVIRQLAALCTNKSKSFVFQMDEILVICSLVYKCVGCYSEFDLIW